MNQFNYKKYDDITVLSATMSDFKYKKHSHEEYSLGVTLRGIQDYNISGSFQSSHENGVMLFNPEDAHDGMSHDKSGIDYVMLYVKPEKFLEIIDKKEIVKFRDQLVYNKILQKSILDVASSILSGANENISNDLIVNLGEAIQPTLMDQEMIDDILIKRAKNIIDNRLDGPFKLEDVCYDMGISKYKFIRLFKKSSGISPYQYYLNKKVQKVKKIIEKDKDIYRAVEECNFVDLTHMNRHFKGMFGVTPYEYLLNMK